MRTKPCWLLLLCLLSALGLSAQSGDDSTQVDKNRHFILSWGTGVLFIPKRPGVFTVSFPYYSNYSTSTGQFSGRLGNPFSQDLVLQDFFNLEFFSLHHSIDFHVGMMPNDDHQHSTYSDAIYFAGGYSHAFSVGKYLMIKTGTDLAFYQFCRGLGSIDNRGVDLNLLGYDSGPTFSVTTSNRYGSTTKYYVTDRLAVDFIQDVLAFTPSVRITSPPDRKFYWAVQATWFLPVIDKGGLDLTQLDSAGEGHSFQSRFQLIRLDEPGITATFNGQPVHHSPYNLGGFYLGGTVGICLKTGGKNKRSRTAG